MILLPFVSKNIKTNQSIYVFSGYVTHITFLIRKTRNLNKNIINLSIIFIQYENNSQKIEWNKEDILETEQ